MKFIKNNKITVFILSFLILNVLTFKREMVGSLTTLGAIGTGYLLKYLNDNKTKYKQKISNIGESTRLGLENLKENTKKRYNSFKENTKSKYDNLKNSTKNKYNSLKEDTKNLKENILFTFNNPLLIKNNTFFKKQLISILKYKLEAKNITNEQNNFLTIIINNKDFLISKDLYDKILEFLENLQSKDEENKNKFNLYTKFKNDCLIYNETEDLNETVFNEIEKETDYNNEEAMKKIFPEK